MRAEVRPATEWEVAAFHGRDTEHLALLVDGAIVAMGCRVRIEGRLFLWLTVKGDVRGQAGKIVRATRAVCRSAGEPVYTLCQQDDHPSAPRLLAMIGFVPTQECLNGLRVWAWQT